MLGQPEEVAVGHGREGVPTRSRRRSWLFTSLSTFTALLIFAPAPKVNAQSATAPNETLLNCPAQFITAMVPDGHGGVWVAGEDTGIYHGTLILAPNHGNPQGGPRSSSLRSHYNIFATGRHFDRANSPGLASNHIYALCVDRKGRVWAGTDRHGVCVYNGKKWAHYGILNGPIGSHVVAIAYNRFAHQVWMASEAGISIYQCGGGENAGESVPARIHNIPRYAAHTWRYITGMNGLPANPDCVAFNKQGTAFVGTLCGDLAVSPYPYRHWRVIIGPSRMPRTATGFGLPGNLINCVSVGRNGTVYVGTDLGLAVSKNNGGTFRYERGSDYAAKVLGLWHPPAGYRSPSPAFLKRLLPGDHVTSVTQDALHNIWIATWSNGYAVLNPRNGQSYRSENDVIAATYYNGQMIQRGTDEYVARLCPVNVKVATSQNDGASCHGQSQYHQIMLIGRYGDGVCAFDKTLPAAESKVRVLPKAEPSATPALPQAAKAPTAQQLVMLCRQLESQSLPPAKSVPAIIPITSDWRTQGSWLGRYGRYWACLFAAASPEIADMVWGPGPLGLSHLEFIGPHVRPRGDSIRFWTESIFTGDSRALQIIPIYDQIAYAEGIGGEGHGDRRDCQIDDHGEVYPSTWQGPDVNVTLHIPRGEYTLALYDYNDDGHDYRARNRDYTISAEVLPLDTNVSEILRQVGSAYFYDRPAELVGRIVNFSSGVWNRYLVRGPMVVLVRVNRNYSFNTMLASATLDILNEHPAPYYYGMNTWRKRLARLSQNRRTLRLRWTKIRDTLPKVGEIMPSGNHFAKRLLRDEEFILHENPRAWAESDQLVYTSLFRRLVARNGQRFMRARRGQLAMAARVAYRLSLFSLWEHLEELLGITTSRQIEKSLRWNKVDSSYRGLDFWQIREYVRRLAVERFAANAN